MQHFGRADPPYELFTDLSLRRPRLDPW